MNLEGREEVLHEYVIKETLDAAAERIEKISACCPAASVQRLLDT